MASLSPRICLRAAFTFGIFGSPMQSWRSHMPKGMLLKSEGFASSLYDPGSSFTLRHYCEEMRLPYDDVGTPVPLEVFVTYGIEFQKRLVPTLEQTDITSVIRTSEGFELETADGQIVHARTVIVATGITHSATCRHFSWVCLAAMSRIAHSIMI